MLIRTCTAALSVALIASAALAQATPRAAPAVPAVNAAPSKTAASDKMVCKTIATTGTRFVSHDCRTQAEWDQLAADSRQMTADQQHAFGRPQ